MPEYLLQKALTMIGKLFARGYSCHDTLEQLQSYLDGETDSKTARKVASHLADCPPCHDELGIYEEIKTRLARPQIEVDPTVLAALTEFGRRIAD